HGSDEVLLEAGGLLLPVAAHAVAQALRLADVQHASARILHEVHAGPVGQLPEDRLELWGHGRIVGGATNLARVPRAGSGSGIEGAGRSARPLPLRGRTSTPRNPPPAGGSCRGGRWPSRST